MKKYLTRLYLPALLGASVEYYDVALYGYMAPILVKIFLPDFDKATAYFYFFLFEFFAALCQVLGAKIFGNIGDTVGRKRAMYQSMIGTSCVTFLICLLPTYEHCGLTATFLFALMRAAQSFFLGGEYNGGAIYCLEHEHDRTRHGFLSGLYCAFTVSGIILASLIATVCTALGPHYFRCAYAMSFFLALGTYRARANIKETPEFTDLKSNHAESTFKIDHARRRLLAIALGSLFFGIIYGLPTRILNVLLPLSTAISTSHIMAINTIFLLIYMVLLLLIGSLVKRYGAKRIMRLAVLFTGLLAYPITLIMDTNTLLGIIVGKAIFALLAAAFIAPFHSWAQQLFPSHKRYAGISIGYCVGKCSSTVILACSVLVFDHYHRVTSLSLFFLVIAIITMSIFYEDQPATKHRSMSDHREQAISLR